MPMPTFLIVGERRCGTTSLSHLMESHPDVFLCEKRDLGYFIETEARRPRTRNPNLPLTADANRWQRTHSPQDYARHFETGADHRAVGEKSADYLFWTPAHKRIAEYLPEARFIITLRDPVARAWSHYWNEVGKGREKLSFIDALDAEDERCRISDFARNHLSYARRGFYDVSVSRFFAHFPTHRVLVISVEDLGRDPDRTLAKVFRFVGVDPERRCESNQIVQNANWTMIPKAWADTVVVRPIASSYDRMARFAVKSVVSDKYSRRRMLKGLRSVFRKPVQTLKIPGDVKARLTDLYRPHIAELEKILERGFDEWK